MQTSEHKTKYILTNKYTFKNQTPYKRKNIYKSISLQRYSHLKTAGRKTARVMHEVIVINTMIANVHLISKDLSISVLADGQLIILYEYIKLW